MEDLTLIEEVSAKISAATSKEDVIDALAPLTFSAAPAAEEPRVSEPAPAPPAHDDDKLIAVARVAAHGVKQGTEGRAAAFAALRALRAFFSAFSVIAVLVVTGVVAGVGFVAGLVAGGMSPLSTAASGACVGLAAGLVLVVARAFNQGASTLASFEEGDDD